MIKYAKIIDKDTKQCEVGLGTNSAFYESIGMIKIDVEEAYNGIWYVSGYAPIQTIEEQNEVIRKQRNVRYSSDIDYLHSRKMRKQVLNDWSETDEADYIAEVATLTASIENDLPYLS